MDRAFERAFATVAQHIPDPQAKEAAKVQSEEDRLRQETAPISAADAVARLTLAFRDGDYFRMLQLPRPDVDELGRPVWGCTDSDVSRAYRRLSVYVHPDKVPGDAARQAFEHLNQAYRELRDPGKLEELLKKAAVQARGDKERREAAATVAERVEINARANEKRKELRKQEVCV
ncbi:MAG: hypothetical protein J3K34DRAFT_412992 [Monoraphidium minutum]|nr:MAG: hypothetical protein J3K34DRAFT_412992 [Monoraphidium minutum]